MKKTLLIIWLSLLTGCSDRSVNWPTPVIHGDNRSEMQRYQDCLLNSKNSEKRSERARCTDESQFPDPGYRGISFPINF